MSDQLAGLHIVLGQHSDWRGSLRWSVHQMNHYRVLNKKLGAFRLCPPPQLRRRRLPRRFS
jgi:hypothetical protein